jgi:hypothetical protein
MGFIAALGFGFCCTQYHNRTGINEGQEVSQLDRVYNSLEAIAKLMIYSRIRKKREMPDLPRRRQLI